MLVSSVESNFLIQMCFHRSSAMASSGSSTKSSSIRRFADHSSTSTSSRSSSHAILHAATPSNKYDNASNNSSRRHAKLFPSSKSVQCFANPQTGIVFMETKASRFCARVRSRFSVFEAHSLSNRASPAKASIGTGSAAMQRRKLIVSAQFIAQRMK